MNVVRVMLAVLWVVAVSIGFFFLFGHRWPPLGGVFAGVIALGYSLVKKKRP